MTVLLPHENFKSHHVLLFTNPSQTHHLCPFILYAQVSATGDAVKVVAEPSHDENDQQQQPLTPDTAVVSPSASDESPPAPSADDNGNAAAGEIEAQQRGENIVEEEGVEVAVSVESAAATTPSINNNGVSFPIPSKAPSFTSRSSSNISHKSSASATSYNTSTTLPTTPGRSASNAPLSVLFLSSDTGGGHRASAMSLARQFELLHPGSTYQLLDVVTECMPVGPLGQYSYPSFGLMPSGPPSPSLSSSSLVDDGLEHEAADGAAAAAVDSEVEDITTAGDGSDNADSNSSNAKVRSPSAKVVHHVQSCIDELSFSPSTDNLVEAGNANNANANTNNPNDDLPLPPLPPRRSSGNTANGAAAGAAAAGAGASGGAHQPAFKKSASAPPAFGIESFYKHLSAHPQQWRLLYHTSNSPPVRLLTDVGLKLATERTVTAKIRDINPDVVVSVHPLMTAIPSLACAKISSDTGQHLPFFTVVTDLGSGHDAWFAGKREVERIFLASDSITELAVKRGKIPRDKIVRSGLPIRHEFAVHANKMGPDGRASTEQAVPYRMSIRRDKLDLCPDPDHKVVLVMGGGEGNGALSSIVDSLYVELCSRSVDATVVVVCGRNAVLKEALETRDWDGLRKRGHKRAERRRKTVVLAQRVRRMLSSISTGDLRGAAATDGEEEAASSSAVVRFEEEEKGDNVEGGDNSADVEDAADTRPGAESPASTVDTTPPDKKSAASQHEMDTAAPVDSTPTKGGDDSDSNLITEGLGATCGASLCLADARDENDSDGDDKFDTATPGSPTGCLSPVSSMESLSKAGSASVQVKPLGFVTNMAEYMVGADLLISKAGPGTIAEAAALGLPVLLTSYLPGQEEGNLDFVLKNEFGAYVADSDPDGVARQCSSWLRDEEKLAEMSKKASKAGVPNAAEDIARYIGQSVIRWKVHNEAH